MPLSMGPYSAWVIITTPLSLAQQLEISEPSAELVSIITFISPMGELRLGAAKLLPMVTQQGQHIILV